jgi:hypothetical protein
MVCFRLGLTPESNVWVGAWWIGFLLSAILCGLLALPLLAFPASLPGKCPSNYVIHYLIQKNSKKFFSLVASAKTHNNIIYFNITNILKIR